MTTLTLEQIARCREWLRHEATDEDGNTNPQELDMLQALCDTAAELHMEKAAHDERYQQLVAVRETNHLLVEALKKMTEERDEARVKYATAQGQLEQRVPSFREFSPSRRDMFAAAALQGITANARIHEQREQLGRNEVAERAVELTDAIIAELDKPKKS